MVSRRQVLAQGGSPADIERALRRREWVRLLPGVFVDHTGKPTWLQRAWAGVLFYEPAALAGMSALRAVAGPGWRRHPDHRPIEIVVDVSRTVRPTDGYRPSSSRQADRGRAVERRPSQAPSRASRAGRRVRYAHRAGDRCPARRRRAAPPDHSTEDDRRARRAGADCATGLARGCPARHRGRHVFGVSSTATYDASNARTRPAPRSPPVRPRRRATGLRRRPVPGVRPGRGAGRPTVPRLGVTAFDRGGGG